MGMPRYYEKQEQWQISYLSITFGAWTFVANQE